VSTVLEMAGLAVRRGGRTVLGMESLQVGQGEVLGLIGPNGAGKSTLLLALARLIQPDEGRVLYRGRPIRDDLAYRRKIALVLQEPLLLSGSVRDNVCTGLRFRGLPRAEATRRADEWLERLGIGGLGNRPAAQVSGGEAQRASLARAFALNPEVILLDEPFSALDAPSRTALLADLQALLAETRMTTVLVTHDQDEALTLSDRLGVLLEGRLRQIGPPESIFSTPVDEEVAAFVGVETTVTGRVIARENGQVTVDVAGQRLEAVAELSPGRQVICCLRPEDVTLWTGGALPPSSARNQLPGTIVALAPRGALVHVRIDCGFPVGALITRASARDMALVEGAPVTVTFKASAVHLIPRQA
jgi:molybdopterin-binding protein